MTEIIMHIFAISILHIEILISLGHWMNLWDMGDYMDTFCHLAGLVYQDKSVIVDLWPLRCNTMQIPAFRKELTAHGIGRNNNFGLSIMLQEVS